MTKGHPTETDLLATALGIESHQDWLLRVGQANLSGRQSLTKFQLSSEFAVPRSVADRLLAVWQLAALWRSSSRPGVHSVQDALLVLDPYRAGQSEHVVTLMMDARNRVISAQVVALGSINASRFQPREVFAPAISQGAASIIVAHNHPSGDVFPSQSDRVVTEALRSAGELLGVPLIDHIILSQDDHYSFRESEGWLQAA